MGSRKEYIEGNALYKLMGSEKVNEGYFTSWQKKMYLKSCKLLPLPYIKNLKYQTKCN